jgi:short-subunit dehydrogenase
VSLKGRTVVLTGGTRGIGARVARELILNRANVVVVGRNRAEVSAVRHLKGDLSNIEGISTLAATVAAENPDILVNLAGAQYCGAFARQTIANVQENITVNLLAPVLLTQSVLPAMLRRGSGHIVNIGSIFGSINYPHFSTYSSAKAGLRGFSEALRRELHGLGIDVTYIAPRAVSTATNSATVVRFAQLARMKMDDPDSVARQIVRAIIQRRTDVFIGFPERLFVRINALVPRVVDVALRAETARARGLFTP